MKIHYLALLFVLTCVYPQESSILGPKPEAISERWAGLIGRYSNSESEILVLEDGGRLFLLTEDSTYSAMIESDPDVFVICAPDRLKEEKIIFTRDPSGRAIRCEIAGFVYERISPSANLRIQPVLPIEQLRTDALAASPPQESGDFLMPDLVDLSTLDPTLKFDIRYATEDNFMGVPLYEAPQAFLQRPAARALLRAHREAAASGYGLVVFDAYRPWYVTKIFWDATPEDKKDFVANPVNGSRHNRGAAVDVTLYDLSTGEIVAMPSDYDEFSESAHVDYPGGTSLQRWHSKLLRTLMEKEGFLCEPCEWWHFNYKDWQKYPIGNTPFSELMGE